VKARALAVTGVASVAIALSGSGMAMAGTTSGNGSVLGGNQISLPITVPVNLCGNAVAVLGVANAACQGGASVGTPASGGASASGGSTNPGTTSGSGSIGGGNQISVPITVPVNLCGNAVAVLGTATASCTPRQHHVPPPPPPPHHCHHHRPPQHHPRHHGVHRTPPPVPQSHQVVQIPQSGTLPITGMNLAGLGGGALGMIAAGIMGLFGGRRRI
jgi:hypothetical protein